MDKKEFTSFRKKLDKTQKELASLLGVSLKAVCSYEQGWRTVPSHVARQLIFLLAQMIHSGEAVANCWEIRNCPDEKKKKCPAWEFKAGENCWFIGGTICDGTTHMSWEEKIEVCKKCEIFKKILDSELP